LTAITLYFQVHQPHRLNRLGLADIGASPGYFDDGLDRLILERVAERCYLPMNQLLREAIEESEGRFRCAFALTGTVLDQLEAWAPEALRSFVDLTRTGCVEIVSETSHHSLACEGDMREFDRQVRAHRKRLTELFGTEPRTFRNTELIFDDEIARHVEDMGFEALLGEGADQLLLGRSPRRVYRPGGCSSLELLLRDYRFSDDIAFRFSNVKWDCYPLMADTFVSWLRRTAPEDRFIGLYMDYETFGEHQGPHTGIFDFMRCFVRFALEEPGLSFLTPIEVASENEPVEVLSVPTPISWADAERDLSAWLSNPMQRAAHEALYALLPDVLGTGDARLLADWRRLTTSDHVYYMSTKHQSDGDVHEYFSPYDSPHDSFMVFMNVLDDLTLRVREKLAHSTTTEKEPQR